MTGLGGSDQSNLDELLGRTAVTPPEPDELHQEMDADLTNVAIARFVWRNLNAIIAGHPSMPPSLLFEVQARNYAAAEAVAVRRHIDRDHRSVTMIRLLGQIRDLPDVLSWQRYVAMFPWGMQHLGDAQFDEWTTPGGNHLDPAMVASDIDALTAATDVVRHYVNKHIAHLDERRASVAEPSFDDLDQAIDTLFELYQKYGVILTGKDRAVMEPVVQYDWLAPLRIPWTTN